MRKNKKVSHGIIALLLTLAMTVLPVLSSSGLTIARAAGRSIVISTAEEMIAFADNCRLDVWSEGRRVTLAGDIDLRGTDFVTIPYFAGFFDGKGYTVYRSDFEGAVAPVGLFSELREGATVSNLKVIGAVKPQGTAKEVGGIVGRNSGKIINCVFTGTVCGDSFVGGIVGKNLPAGEISGCVSNGMISGSNETGGIAGRNEGTISACENYASVDVNSVDSTIKLDDFTEDLLSLGISGVVAAYTDVGGIAGFSQGFIFSSVNHGYVGYRHVGYNIGGIAGRSCGYVRGCENYGEINGRKDIGGIVGQMEPYIKVAISSDYTETLRVQLNALSSLIDKMTGDLSEGNAALSGRLDIINGYVGDAASDAENLGSELGNYADSVIGEVNRIGAILGETLDRLQVIMKKLEPVPGIIADGLDDMSDSLSAMSGAIDASKEGFADIKNALHEAADGMEEMRFGLRKMSEGLDKIKAAIEVKDEAALRDAVEGLKTELPKLTKELTRVTKATKELTSLFKNASWTGELSAEITELSEEMKKISDAVGVISEQLTVIGENVVIDWDLMAKAADEIENGIKDITEGLKKLADSLSNSDTNDAAQAAGIELLSGNSKEIQQAVDKISKGLEKLSQGLTDFRNAIQLDDNQAVTDALKKINDALGEISDTLGDLSDTFAKMAGTMKDMEAWSKDVTDKAYELAGYLNDVARTLDKISAYLEKIDNNVNIDWDGITTGCDVLKSGFDTIVNSAEKFENALNLFADGIGHLEPAADKLSAGLKSMRKAFDSFKKAAQVFKKTSKDISGLFNYLASVEKIQFPTIPEAVDTSFDSLFDNIGKINEQMTLLNSEASAVGETLTEDLRAINELATEIINSFLDQVEKIKNFSVKDIYKDVSEEELLSVTNGKTEECINHGAVLGDLNVGGVTGTMNLETPSDEEADLGNTSTIFSKVYEVRIIALNCKNYGNISARKNCAGGVAGRVELGLVQGCEGYGAVSAESGDYVGGVAGYNNAKIAKCYAKSTLSGKRYVGGIIGYGAVSELFDSNSIVKNCASLVTITECNQFFGAIAGINNGDFLENVFVSRTLSGIDRVSYAEKAYPVEYHNLAKNEEIPAEFKSFTIKFVVDDQVVKTVEFNYGDSLDKSIMPEIPAKENLYGYWDIHDFDELYFDVISTAVYEDFVVSLNSEQNRDNSRPIFFVEGHFSDWDKLVVTTPDSYDADTAELKRGIIDGISRFFMHRDMSELYAADEVLERWSISIPESIDDAHYVRYLAPPDSKHTRVYVRTTDGWESVKSVKLGSYDRFETAGNSLEIAIVSVYNTTWVLFAIIGVVCLIIILTVVSIVRGKKIRKLEKR